MTTTNFDPTLESDESKRRSAVLVSTLLHCIDRTHYLAITLPRARSARITITPSRAWTGRLLIQDRRINSVELVTIGDGVLESMLDTYLGQGARVDVVEATQTDPAPLMCVAP